MKGTSKHKYRNFLLMCIFTGILAGMMLPVYLLDQQIPDHIYLHEGESYSILLPVPFSGKMKTQSLAASKTSESNVLKDQIQSEENAISTDVFALKLFGFLPVKESTITYLENKTLTPCGGSVGLYLKSDGLLVIGTAAIPDCFGNSVEPAKDLLKGGDYILSCNGMTMKSKEDLVSLLAGSDGKELICTIKRNQEIFDIKMKPIQAEDHSYKLGIWIRDDIQGIGTITYITEDGDFAALGHPISDSDTGKIFETSSGSVYESRIQAIIKGKNGVPGSLSGIICYGKEHYLGSLHTNKSTGVYGTLSNADSLLKDAEALPIAFSQDVKKGTAYIRSNINGTYQEYEIVITDTRNGSSINKQIEFQVVDEKLLAITGGIVQGMSGSPIIQDGKLVGAVTHVLVNDPTRGYGIFIENMLDAAG